MKNFINNLPPYTFYCVWWFLAGFILCATIWLITSEYKHRKLKRTAQRKHMAQYGRIDQYLPEDRIISWRSRFRRS